MRRDAMDAIGEELSAMAGSGREGRFRKEPHNGDEASQSRECIRLKPATPDLSQFELRLPTYWLPFPVVLA